MPPLERLLLPWWNTREEDQTRDPQKMREQLFTAALGQILFKASQSIPYDPLVDHIFRWAVQFLELLEGTRIAIDPDITLNASLKLDPTPFLSRKDFAAGAV